MADSASDSGDDLGLMRKALDVSIPHNFDPSKIPQNGEEYIQHVMFEAKNCKQLVVANIDKSKLKETTYKVLVKEECKRAPASMVPTMEWQEDVLAEFRKLRLYVTSKLVYTFTNDISDNILKGIYRESPPRYFFVMTLDQEQKVKLLQYILDDLFRIKEGETMPYSLAVWLYSILATLLIPLSPHTCHCLRELARRCSVIRSNLPHDSLETAYNPLNLTICVVARYFNQLDLADN